MYTLIQCFQQREIALTIQALHYRALFFALERESFTRLGTYLLWNGKAFTPEYIFYFALERESFHSTWNIFALERESFHSTWHIFALERESIIHSSQDVEHIFSGTGKLSQFTIRGTYLLWNGKTFTQNGFFCSGTGKLSLKMEYFYLKLESFHSRILFFCSGTGKLSQFTRRGTYLLWTEKAFTRRGIYLFWNRKGLTRRGIF